MSNIYRLLLLGSMLSTLPFAAAAQTGIGTTTPDASTRLDVVSSNRGVRLPQVNLASVTDGTTIPLPATSLLVWNSNAALPNGAGYYYNAGTPAAPSWVKLVDSSTGVLAADNGLNKSGSTVKLGGNLTAATTVTTNGNNLSVAGSGTTTTFTSAGLVGIGTASPAQRLHVAGTGGTPNVRLGSLSGTGVRLVTSDANGDLSTNASGVGNGLFWGILGNSGTNPTTNFVGTTDAQDLVLRTNNTEMTRFNRLGQGGQLLVGSNASNTYVNSVMSTSKLPDEGMRSRMLLLGEGGQGDLTLLASQAAGGGVSQINFGVQGGTALNAPTAVPDNSSLGGIKFWGYNGTTSDLGNEIISVASKTTSGNITSDLMFTGGSTYAERMLRLYANKDVEMFGYPNTRVDATAPVNSLYTDATGVLKSKPVGDIVTAGGAVTTANNGLTKSTNNVQLGGNLVKATTVTNNGFALNVAGSNVTTTFTSSGDVGINTTSPLGRLEVVGASAADPGAGDDIDVTSISDAAGAAPAFITRRARGSSVAAPANMQFGDNMGAYHMFGRVNGGWQPLSSISSSYAGDGTTSLSNLRFATSNGERMRITETGAIGVNVASPNASAILDVTSSNKGVLLPRIALVSLTDVATVASPATGLLVFNTTTNLSANLTPGFYYWSGTSWAQLQDTNSAGGSKTKSYAFVGLYADQYTNGIDCGEFSFRLRRRTDATAYGTMNENIDAQAKWNGASGSITALSYAETLYSDAQYDFSGSTAFAPTSAPQTSTRSNNVLNAGTWYSWGEEGFAVSAANQEKRQYILTPAGSSAAEKYFYRIEFAFLVGNFAACPTCNSITNSQEIVNGAKVLILVEKVYN